MVRPRFAELRLQAKTTVRSGAIAVFVETWHKDFKDFLDMKRNSGEDKRLAKELFLGASMSDLFMQRVQENKPWTMFDPYDTPDLAETFGEEFEKRYLHYEVAFEKSPEKFTNLPIVVNAKDLWKRFQKYYWEVGMPFIFFKDNANHAHENPELGIIRSTNLCTEIFQAADENKTILCNLGSINLARVNTPEDLAKVVPIAMRALDNVIDLNHYAIPKSEANQRRTRAVGLGVAGEGELIATKQVLSGSDEHFKFIDELYGLIAKYSDEASLELGKERGEWAPGKGYRNAYRRAIAPTSSIGLIMGTTASHEEAFSKVWIEESKLGNFKVTAPNITPESYPYYVSPYDVDQERRVRANAIRQKHIDQGISFNLYFRPGVPGKKVFDTLHLAHKLKAKSTYYLRSESVKLKEDSVRDTEISCFGCSG